MPLSKLDRGDVHCNVEARKFTRRRTGFLQHEGAEPIDEARSLRKRNEGIWCYGAFARMPPANESFQRAYLVRLRRIYGLIEDFELIACVQRRAQVMFQVPLRLISSSM